MQPDMEAHGCKFGKLPLVSLPNLTAPGPTGERPEHLRDCLVHNNAGARRRLLKALDALTLQWASGMASPEARWLLNTSLTWLKKGQETQLPDEDAMWLLDVPEEMLDNSGSDEDMTDAREATNKPCDQSKTSASGRPAVRPIQVGEFLRKWMTRRLLAIQKLPIQCAMTAAR
eukprot:12425215-Karenia_brevis.AAC.1